MSHYKLSITLLSDLCVSDGGVYNSSLDMDVVYDTLGIPFIPAKRLKGCLRECAHELTESGLPVSVGTLFGEKDDRPGIVRISNAYPEHYDDYRAEIQKNPDAVIYHPQNVLKNFTYIRTETSIDYNTGTAQEASLRTMRVVKRNLVFSSEVEIQDDGLESKERKKLCRELDLCCKTLRHMGMSRTRGLGEISCCLKETGEVADESGKKEVKAGMNKLSYRITLKEPVIIKSVNGGESRSLDHIDGSKIIGIVSERLKKHGEDISALFDQGDIFFSNAYPEYDDKRAVEVPASYYEIKNGHGEVFNHLNPIDEKETAGKQLNQMKHCFICGVPNREDASIPGIKKCDVITEDRYHHRRPNDKAVGRAMDDGSGDSMFYQMSSISEGQSFRGFIFGTEEQIGKIYRLLSESNMARLGYSRSSEYGTVQISCEEPIKEEEQTLTGRTFDIKLESAVLLYSENATYSTDPKVLEEEILTALGIKSEELDPENQTKMYLNYGFIGGFNVTWGFRKPIVGVFEKGSVLRIYLKEDKTITVPAGFRIGERRSEGMGEVTVQVADPNVKYQLISLGDESGDPEKVDLQKNPLAKSIGDKLLSEYLAYYAGNAIQNEKNKALFDMRGKTENRPTVSNLLGMCGENDSLKGVRAAVADRFADKSSEKKQAKNDIANTILNAVKEMKEPLAASFCDTYKVVGFSGEDIPEIQLLKQILVALKYSFREKEVREDEE